MVDTFWEGRIIFKGGTLGQEERLSLSWSDLGEEETFSSMSIRSGELAELSDFSAENKSTTGKALGEALSPRSVRERISQRKDWDVEAVLLALTDTVTFV